MRKSFYYFLGIFGFLIVIALAVFFASGGITGFAVNDHGVVSAGNIESRQVSFNFKDKITGCYLDGEVFVDNVYVGKTNDGVFSLIEGVNGEELKLKGKTSDCFGGNANLGFIDVWKVSSIGDSSYGKTLILETSLDPRNPRSLEEVQSFVRPEETGKYLKDITKYFNGNIENDLDRIASYKIWYRYDSILYSDSYWQTPAETLNMKRGDCEDWATAVLSMMEEYDSTSQCYGVVWESHMSIMCYVNGNYIIYDQGDTKVVKNLNDDITTLEKRVELRKFLESYFDVYGIDSKERKVQGVVNSDFSKSFSDNEEFIDWLLTFN